jgi:hypothetical protein
MALNVMDRLCIDSIGPLPEDIDGNKHILVIIDAFSRFVELYATKSVEAQPAATALLHHLGRYGCPAQITSDNGTQFVNNLLDELYEIMGIENRPILAGSKEENGIVERANQEVMRHLKAILFHRKIKDKWSRVLPLVQRIINSTVHRSLGVTPAQILFGNSIDLDRGLFLDRSIIVNGRESTVTETNTPKKLSAWADEMLKIQAEIISIAQQHQTEINVANQNKHSTERSEFPINSYVLVEYSDTTHPFGGPALQTRHRGPYRVVKINMNHYTVQNLVTNQLEEFQVNLLRPFIYDPTTVDPRDIAMRDHDMWTVEMIVNHKFAHNKPKNKSNLYFKVRWTGFPPESDTWEPYKNLRNVEALHQYLREHKMNSFILRKFK